MGLTRADKERLLDSRHKIQSATSALSEVAPENVPDFDDIQECLEHVDQNLREALKKDARTSELAGH